MNTQSKLHWVLRITAALCFIGHGAWGVITKAGWLPFFASQGIPESIAWPLMPVIGTLDIVMGLLLLWKPRRFILIFMLIWALWTAILRPISGTPGMWEFFERAGNFFPPFILLIMGGSFAMKWKDWFAAYQEPKISAETFNTVKVLCQWGVGLLLIGHGGFGAFVQKPMLIEHFASIGIPATTQLIHAIGWFEIGLGASIIFIPSIILSGFILIWKLFTEFLYVTDGGFINIFEFIERWGDYGLPVALIIILLHQKQNRHAHNTHAQ